MQLMRATSQTISEMKSNTSRPNARNTLLVRRNGKNQLATLSKENLTEESDKTPVQVGEQEVSR